MFARQLLQFSHVVMPNSNKFKNKF